MITLILGANNRPFFAGLFDAEGNVSAYNKSLRWACQKDELVKIYTRYLKKLNLFDRYDGGCLVTYNVKEFYEKIFPFMKHDKKINLLEVMHSGSGKLPEEYIAILNYISNNPLMTQREITKALKKNKVYSELKLLTDFDYIQSVGYPYKYKMTNKGNKTLGRITL